MLNFEEELEKFQPSMDIEKVEDVVYHNNLADVTDIVKELIQDAKGHCDEKQEGVIKDEMSKMRR